MSFEHEYVLGLLETAEGKPRNTRNAITRSQFGMQLKIDDLQRGVFPILLGRKIFWEGVVGELAAFLRGPKSIKDFTDQGCNFWGQWAESDGSIDVDYGNAWLNFNGINQLREVVKSLKEDPSSRRHLINAWRPDRIKNLSLPCCHYSYQWYVSDVGRLDMVWIQRSVDLMIGLPSDIVSAALLNLLMAQTVGLAPGKITMQLGDCHIYDTHMDAMGEYTTAFIEEHGNRKRVMSWVLDPKATVFDFDPSMFKIVNYVPARAIKMGVIA